MTKTYKFPSLVGGGGGIAAQGGLGGEHSGGKHSHILLLLPGGVGFRLGGLGGLKDGVGGQGGVVVRRAVVLGKVGTRGRGGLLGGKLYEWHNFFQIS